MPATKRSPESRIFMRMIVAFAVPPQKARRVKLRRREMSKNERDESSTPDQNQKGINQGSTRNSGRHGGHPDNRPTDDKGNPHGNKR